MQFERLGYARDLDDDPSSVPTMFHRTVGLRDEWANIQKRQDVAGVERAVIPVGDLGAAIEQFEAEGYRLVTISPPTPPDRRSRRPRPVGRLDVTATEAAVITVEPIALVPIVPELVISVLPMLIPVSAGRA